MDKRLQISLLQQRWPWNHKEQQRHIILTVIAIKVYNNLLLNLIQSEIEKILKKKNQNFFQINLPTTSSDSDNPLNHRKSSCKKSCSNTFVCIFLKSIQYTEERWSKYY